MKQVLKGLRISAMTVLATLLILYTLTAIGCQPEVVCNPPYMQFGTTCCMDQNSNSICDSDEIIEEPEPEPEPIIEEPEPEPEPVIVEEEPEPEPKLSIEDALKSVVIVEVLDEDGDVLISGSGFFADPEGYILTNTHVIGDYSLNTITFRVKRNSGTYYDVSLIDANWNYDLALLKVKEDLNYDLPTLQFGSVDDMKLGDVLYALGSPMGLEFSMSKGALSAKDRQGMNDESIKKYIQIDASLNPGNSGGPIINEEGRVVGVATFGYLYLEGLNFALESDAAKKLYLVMKTVKAPIADASVSQCRLSRGVFVQPFSTYGIENYDSTIEGKKPSELNMFYKQANDKIYFNDIVISLENKDSSDKNICFNFKIISNAKVLFNKNVGEQVTIKSKSTMSNYPVEIGFNSPYTTSLYYYELNAFDCASKETHYSFYRRDWYSEDYTSGDITVFKTC